MPKLIKILDLEDTIIMADGLNCQYEITNAIVEKKGNYVLVVKCNKKDLYDDVVDYLKKNSGKNYNKLTSVGMVKRTMENLITSEIKQEERYYINSIYDIDLFSKTVRKKWSIENKLHWHLDYTLKEDNSTIIDKKVALNLNIIRKKCFINA